MTKEPELLKRFKDAIETGRKGDVDSFELWLKERGIQILNMQKQSYSKFIIENPKELIDRFSEIETIANFVGYFIKNKESFYHLVLTGLDGVGKSLLVGVLRKLIYSLNEDLNVQILDAYLFNQFDEDGFPEIDNITEELSRNIPDVLIIDSCEKDDYVVDSFKRFLKKFKNCLLISVWDSVSWNYYKDSLEEVLMTTKEIPIEPFDLNISRLFIDKYINYISENQKEINTDITNTIFMLTKGIPKIIMTLINQSLFEAFYKQMNEFNLESIKTASKTLKLQSIEEKLNEISDLQTMILKKILLNRDDRGVRPVFLSEEFNLKQASIIYHLKFFRDNRLISKKKFGRSTFYFIDERIKPLIQRKIIMESEFLD